MLGHSRHGMPHAEAAREEVHDLRWLQQSLHSNVSLQA